jgi:AcrR family transcriptional regulator
MASERRIGAEDSQTRLALIDAAQLLMIEEGYAAVTSRRVAAKAGLKPQLVHYYFRTMDDLFVAMLRRGAEHNLERQAQALASPEPLRALWEVSFDPTGTALAVEFTALANHRKAIRAEIAAFAEQFRQGQADALAAVYADYGIDPDGLPPITLLVLMTAVSRVVAMERSLGISSGHEETLALVEGLLTRLEADRRS